MNEPMTTGTRPHRTVSEAEVEAWVVQRDQEADDVISLRLAPRHADRFPLWEPGAHIDVVLDDGLVRQYSLCGDPEDTSSYRIAVLKDEAGRGGSKQVHEAMWPQSTLVVRGPRNHFELAPNPSYLFIAGGIGITPLLPMIAEAVRRGAHWTLLYGGRTRSSMAFLNELGRYGEHVVIRPEEEFGLLDLDAAIDASPAGALVYVCGPEPLLRAVEEASARRGRPAPRLERFSPVPVAPHMDSPFEVYLQQSERSILVAADVSILKAVEEQGMSPAFSCREGTCGTCETAVLEGEVEHRDSILTEDERQANDTMMICVSRCLSSRLVLDM